MATHGRIGAALAAIRAWLIERPERLSLVRVAAYVVSTRVLLFSIGYFAVRFEHPRLLHRLGRRFSHSAGVVGWLRWDVGWYLSIVDQGYSFDPLQASNVAFLPGFPAPVALLDRVLKDSILSGLIVANASFVAAIVVLWGSVRERAGLRAAERAVIWLLLFPLSFFLNTLYAEGLFFLLCTLALHRAHGGHWISAGIYACFASLTRPTGIFLVPAFAWELGRLGRLGRFPRQGVLALVLPLAGLGGYAVYLWVKFGSPFAVLTAQRVGWYVGDNFNLPGLQHHGDFYREILDVFQFFLPLLLIALAVRAWRFGATATVYAALAATVGIVLGGESLGREALSVVPAFAVAGMTNFSPTITIGLRVCFFALLVTFAYAFVMGHSMG
jgi:hypothetical protein